MFIIVELSFCPLASPLLPLQFHNLPVPASTIMMLLSMKHAQLAHTAVQMEGLKPPPLSGVHLRTPPEYMPLQHPFLHWEFLEHCTQSPSVPVEVVGGVDAGGVGALVHGPL